jgi:DNA helicase-2/ATP-dependent DNA helicase PcrA
MVSYRRCPRQFYWLAIRPLPRRRSEAALLGTEIHRWIEQRSDRQLGLIDLEDEEVDPGAAGGTASGAGGWRAAFLRSPYGSLDPERVEAPFVLVLDGRMVRGRVDAVYRRDQRLELVDFKTGSAPADGDRGAGVQLDLYAMAAVDVWREDPAELRTTYCYLRGDGTYALVSTDWDEDRLAVVRADLRAALTGLAAGEYAATPGPWCGRCEWREVCRPGRAYLEAP